MENEKTSESKEKKIKHPKILLAIMAYQTLNLLAIILLLGYTVIEDPEFVGELEATYILGLIINLPLWTWQIISMWKLHVNAFYITLGLFVFSSIYYFIDGANDLFSILVNLALCIYLFNLRNARILLSNKEKEHLLPEDN